MHTISFHPLWTEWHFDPFHYEISRPYLILSPKFKDLVRLNRKENCVTPQYALRFHYTIPHILHDAFVGIVSRGIKEGFDAVCVVVTPEHNRHFKPSSRQ